MRIRSGAIAGATGLALLASVMMVPSGPVMGAAPDPAPGRLAFTDAQDSVRQISLVTGDGLVDRGDWTTTVEELGAHSGEVRGESAASEETPTGGYAFVSSRPTSDGPAAGDPDGEVWYRALDPVTEANRYVQVTDDAATESHPDAWVVEKDCYSDFGEVRIDVAFASNRSGNWDIWVAQLVRDPAAPANQCEALVVESVRQVTADPGDDLWPAWALSREGVRSIVFSSTRSDPRGDLYQVVVGPDDPLPPPADALTQLTQGPEADAQPAPRQRVDSPQICPGDPLVGGIGLAGAVEPRWLAFTRASDDDPRGGLAVLDLEDPGGGVLSLGVSAASEPDWSQDGVFLAYRSTAGDPDGDVLVGRFVRECPPDLAVESVSVTSVDPPSPIVWTRPVNVQVVVANLSSRPASGSVEIDFSTLLAFTNDVGPTKLCDPANVCTVTLPELAGLGESGDHAVLSWSTATGNPMQADDVGSGVVAATVSVDGPVTDAVPANDTGTASFSVQPLPIDVQLAADPDSDGVTASPSLLNFSDATATLPTTVTVLVHNPGPQPVTTTIVVSSDSALALSGGSQSVTRTVVDLPPTQISSPRVETFDFTVTRPPANSPVSVGFTATLTVALPVVDPNPNNNTGGAQVSLNYIVITSTPAGSLRITDGFYRGPRTPTVIGAGLAHARPLVGPVARPAVPQMAAVPLAVPLPMKPAVEDAVSLASITVISDTYGLAESHPAFVEALVNGSLVPTLMLTERSTRSVVTEILDDGGLTQRAVASDISDLISTDGSARRKVVDDATYAVGRPAYSPDGRFIAFDRARCDVQSQAAVGCAVWGSEVVVAKADGSDPAPIYPAVGPRPEGAQDVNPAWSPDGTSIAFTRIPAPPSVYTEPRQPQAIWVARGLDLAGSPVDLVASGVAQVTTPDLAVGEGDIDEFDDGAAWSPDGAKLAFTRARGYVWGSQGAYDEDIWLVTLASQAEKPLMADEIGSTEGDNEEDQQCPESTTTVCRGGDDRGADWSPDGTRIVYEHTGWLYLADPATGEDLGPLTGPRVLDVSDSLPLYPDDAASGPDREAARGFPALEWAQDPAWSPNGDRIAFAGQPRGRPDQRGIYWLTVPATQSGRQVKEIAQQPQPELEPDWQPTADLAITLAAEPASVLQGAGAVLTMSVTNEGPAPAIAAVAVLSLPAGLTAGTLPAGCVAGPPVTCAIGTMADRASVKVAIPVSGTAVGSQTATATTNSRTLDPDPLDNTASTTVTVTQLPPPPPPPPPVPGTTDLGVSLAVDPSPGYVGGSSVLTVTVTNQGQPAAVTLSVTVPEEVGPPDGDPCLTQAGCALGSVPSGVPLVKTYSLAPQAAVDAKGTAVVSLTPLVPPDPETPPAPVTDPNPDNDTAEIPIVVLQPILELLPPIGPPGFATFARGEDFPPDASVQLEWNPGLNALGDPLTVAEDGSFEVPVVVLMHDQLGPRILTATGVEGLEFAPVEADFLVVPRTQQPPEFQGRG